MKKHPGGRPLKFNNPIELYRRGIEFFADCDKNGKPYTVTGLAIWLETTRETLMEYQARPKFTDTIKRLKTYCERYAEERLFGNNPTGAIFALKNYGWSDRQEHEISGKVGV